MASFVCLFRSGGPCPVFLSVFVLRGLQSAHLPLPGGTVTAWDTPSGRGELCQGSVVSCVPASCVHIWFVSCPCFMSLWVHLCPAVCMWLCVNYPVYISPVFWVWFGLVYSLLPGVSCLSAWPCPALSTLKTIIEFKSSSACSCILPRVCTVTKVNVFLKFASLFLLYTKGEKTPEKWIKPRIGSAVCKSNQCGFCTSIHWCQEKITFKQNYKNNIESCLS